MNQQPFSFILRIEDFDLSRLPIAADALRANPDLLTQAISEYYAAIFRKLGGTANVAIAAGAVHVSWAPQTGDARDLLFERCLGLLKQGNYREAEPLLQCLHARFPNDQDVLYNYGMMLSDQGRLDQACRLLERLVEIVPGHSHGWTALGVAHARNRDKQRGLAAFQTALQLDPANAYAMRNAAAILAQASPADAIPLYEKAAELLPEDQRTLFGYGACLLRLGRQEEADPILIKCIAINPLSDVAEEAKTARTKLAHENMRGNVAGGIRPDVVMYLLGAMKRFRDLGRMKTGTIAFEIAMLGRNGLDINNPAQKYTLKSLPGQFSGLHLVSIMYAGMKILDPSQDAGIDLSREYSEAKKLFDMEQSHGTK
jgi:tetratricopeptide (TPR) repeat protein